MKYQKAVILTLRTRLDIGEHDFVKVPTYMNYYQARVRNKRWIDENGRRREPPVGKPLLQRICDGITNTEHIQFDVYDAYLFRKR